MSKWWDQNVSPASGLQGPWSRMPRKAAPETTPRCLASPGGVVTGKDLKMLFYI